MNREERIKKLCEEDRFDKCCNCNELLNKHELEAKIKENGDEWICCECYDEDDTYSEHGKYIILLNFVKKLTNKEHCKKIECLSCEAFSILKEIKS